MGLKDLELKQWYDSDTDDILNSFYLPSLSQAVFYKRLVGFFSSASFAITAKGILNLIKNGGKIQLITSPKFQENDLIAIKETYESVENLTEKIMLEELSNIDEDFIKDHVKALSWMLKNNLLEIKVALILDDKDQPLDAEVINKQGIFHQKVGIIEDSEGNKLSFSGSENESILAWIFNIEEFKVFRNWINSELVYYISDEIKFDKFWNGNSSKTKIIDLPLAVQQKLLDMSPHTIEELQLEKWYKYNPTKKKVSLRQYQNEAITKWVENNYLGIFEMATGTGKTFTALGCIDKLTEKNKQLITIIACPYNHLVTQWKKEIKDYGFSTNIISADSSNSKWKEEVKNAILDINIGINDQIILLTTHDTLSSENFKNIMIKTDLPILLVVDEVHGIGAPKSRESLLQKYKFRLGLSATPKRWFDFEGTDILFEYFGGTVYEYPLAKAIGQFLVEYEYHPHFITLSDDELEEYEKETKKIIKNYYIAKDDKEKEQWYTLLLIKRQEIVKNAQNKYNVLEEFIKNNKEITYCLIYCGPKQINTVQDILLKYNIKQHKFTEDEGIKPIKDYNGNSEREIILKQFSKGTLQILVAMKCLDEGVNIPAAKYAFMLSNSGNPREYIQRMGRVLRKYPGKEFSIIHDVIVIPSENQIDSPQFELEKRILLKELTRYREFASLSKNSLACLATIQELEDKFKIYR